MKKTAILAALIVLWAPALFALPEFGETGLNGLTEAQKQDLAAGKIIFTTQGSISQCDSELIYAAIVFDKPATETWALISKTEDQDKYLSSIKDLKIICKSGPTDNIQFSVSVGPFTKTFRVIHHFSPDKAGIEWGLDPSFDNDLQELSGFWRFYDFGEGKTLARYGSQVGIRGVPDWVEGLFKKRGISEALGQVKQYVDSGGTWRCRR